MTQVSLRVSCFDVHRNSTSFQQYLKPVYVDVSNSLNLAACFTFVNFLHRSTPSLHSFAFIDQESVNRDHVSVAEGTMSEFELIIQSESEE